MDSGDYKHLGSSQDGYRSGSDDLESNVKTTYRSSSTTSEKGFPKIEHLFYDA